MPYELFDADGTLLHSEPDPPPAPPDEAPMHKVEKAAVLTPWEGHANLAEAIEWALGQLPAPKNVLGLIEWKRAPKLVRLGATTSAVMQVLGMTEAQRDELLIFAETLP